MYNVDKGLAIRFDTPAISGSYRKAYRLQSLPLPLHNIAKDEVPAVNCPSTCIKHTCQSAPVSEGLTRSVLDTNKSRWFTAYKSYIGSAKWWKWKYLKLVDSSEMQYLCGLIRRAVLKLSSWLHTYIQLHGPDKDDFGTAIFVRWRTANTACQGCKSMYKGPSTQSSKALDKNTGKWSARWWTSCFCPQNIDRHFTRYSAGNLLLGRSLICAQEHCWIMWMGLCF